MPQAHGSLRRFTGADVQSWYRSREGDVYLGDVVDSRNGDTMSVGFARYGPGQSNDWVVTYDEVLIVTRGTFTVTAADGPATTARAGEVIALSKGTKIRYSAEDAGAEVVYVTYPHWVTAQQQSKHAALLDTFRPTEDAPQRVNVGSASDNIALMERIWGPLERGESADMQPFFDALAEDVVFELPVGKAHGKDAVIGYFANVFDSMEVQPFVKPLEYYANGDRIVILGAETFKVKGTAITHRADWAWVVDMQDGLIKRIVHIQDLSGIADFVLEALTKATQAGETPSATA